MATQEERFSAIETELGIVSKEALTKLDLHTEYIHDTKARLAIMDTRLGTMDQRLNWMDMHLSTVVEDTRQTNVKLDAMNLRLNQLETVLNGHTKHLNQLETILNGHTKHLNQLETVLNGHTKLFAQILERLPEKP
jgi:DNA repair ATPase RecN